VLVDVRGDPAWRSRHATGALSIPLEDIEAAPNKALAGVPAGKRPILYCT
jgi:rhodanese-related sulfurtransferase